MGRKDLVTGVPLAPAEVPLPGLARTRLRNGLDLVVVPRPHAAVATATLVVKAGQHDDPRDRPGLAVLAGSLLSRGTEARAADALSTALPGAGPPSVQVGPDGTRLGCTVLAADLPRCVELLAEMVQRPAFAPRDIEALREDLARSLTERHASPAALGASHFDNLVFGEDHPDGRVALPEHVRRISRDDVVAFWKRHFRPNNAVLIVVGHPAGPGLTRQIEQAFGAWAPGSVPPRPAYASPERKGARLLLMDQPEALATVLLGHRVAPPAHPDHATGLVLAEVLGPRGQPGRLARALVDSGVARAAWATLDASRAGGALSVTLEVDATVALAAITAATDVLRALKKQGPTETELTAVRSLLMGRHALELQAGADLARVLAAAELTGVGIPHVKQLSLRLGRIDLARARIGAESVLQPDNAVVVIAGQAAVIAPQLEKAGLKFERITAGEPVSYIERARRRKILSAAPAETSRARELLRLALEAQGGVDRLRAIQRLKVVKSGVRREGDLKAEILVTSYHNRPGYLRLEQELAVSGQKHKNVLVLGPRGAKGGPPDKPLTRVPPDNERRLRASLFEDVNFLLMNVWDHKPALPMQVGAPIEDRGQALDTLEVRLPSGEWATLFFDRSTHLLARIKSRGENGEETTEHLEDWRDVKGYKFPFRQRSPGPVSSEATVTAIEVDPALPASLFE